MKTSRKSLELFWNFFLTKNSKFLNSPNIWKKFPQHIFEFSSISDILLTRNSQFPHISGYFPSYYFFHFLHFFLLPKVRDAREFLEESIEYSIEMAKNRGIIRWISHENRLKMPDNPKQVILLQNCWKCRKEATKSLIFDPQDSNFQWLASFGA